jgi:3-dehydroquinate synthase
MSASPNMEQALAPQPDFVLRYAGGESTALIAGYGVLRHLGRVVASLPPRRPARVFLCSDEQVLALHGAAAHALLAQEGLAVETLAIPAGEEQKTLANVADAYERLARYGAERGDVLVACGGGVVGDLFGFVAATYLRGIRLVQAPTTVVAQVDSSLGGKVGVDLPAGKNLVGAFKHPVWVVADHHLLTTLPEAEWVAGTAEVAKHGVIADAGLFETLEAQAEAWRGRTMDLAPVLAAAIAVKARVVQEDEHETGPRMILNYGHTFGHALEAAAHYHGIRHGEAVAWGMAMEARLAERLGLSSAAFVARQDRLLLRLGLLQALPRLDGATVYQRLFIDKKVQNGALRWLLPGKEPGSVSVRADVPLDLVRELVERTVAGALLTASG